MTNMIESFCSRFKKAADNKMSLFTYTSEILKFLDCWISGTRKTYLLYVVGVEQIHSSVKAVSS